MNISPISFYNQKSIHPIFRARHEFENEKIVQGKDDTIIHVSNFFREPKTDKFVQQYILDNFSKNKNIQIVSAGCSQGEEAYSYYVMLDSLQDKLNISGFDLSKKTIQDAKKGIFSLKNYEQRIIDSEYPSYLTSYERKCREKFHAHFEPVDEDMYKQPPYCSYRRCESSIYKLKDGEKGCNFAIGNVLDLDKMYKENSIDVLLFKNTLYHLTCKVDNGSLIGYRKHDDEKTIANIAKQMGKVVKKGGLVVFGENEERQHVNVDRIRCEMIKNGFEPIYLYKDPIEYRKLYDGYYNYSEPYSHVWKKVSD